MEDFRIERDTMGEVKVPADKYWGAQTQRSHQNFRVGNKMPDQIIRAFAYLKKGAALANERLGNLESPKAEMISKVCDEILDGSLDGNFPLVVYQTGSGTQSNMNVNEVIANRGNELAGEKLLHPNDDVNRSQSSNDTFPTAMSIAAVVTVEEKLLPAAEQMTETLRTLEDKYMHVVKTGRTHLQDAVPMTFGQEISGWRSMIEHSTDNIKASLKPLREIALGGTAVGTGLNAPEGFDKASAEIISRLTGHDFVTAPNKFHALSSKDAFVYAHGALKAMAADLMKMANDIRWLSSGPRCGLGEITIPSNEPGSSIMPGKVNPTQTESATMVAVRVMGNDTVVGMAASQGNFQLNVFMPVIADAFIQSAELLAQSLTSLELNCVRGIEPIEEKMEENARKSLMVAAALNTHVGYEAGAKAAKWAHKNGTTLKEAAVQLNICTDEEYERWVDLKEMTGVK
ncbi:class II fumarate hydratase [Clostridiales Family XIII bacterium RF-744-FAT-WT-3]|uniref:Fumarate hydratase class II n=1 Tax=Baileyella intestinalis TaxID=2606709 RepID=A0A6A8M638_9FIRM|nr:class II fumarate hydratase [Baileyella intestinalis]MST68401.1 class II fumarate hydratase [Baileyella intestinalis]